MTYTDPRRQPIAGEQLLTRGGETAVAANSEVVPAGELRAAEQRIRELDRALGRKTMEVEILQAAREEVKKTRTAKPAELRARGLRRGWRSRGIGGGRRGL